MRIVVAVATYDRPRQLAALLASLADGGLDGVDAEVVIVDNAPSPSAAGVAERWASDLHLRCVWESTPGIAAARNRGIEEAGSADAVVFVDDDETVTPGWAKALLETHRATGADLVTGPVVPVYDDSPAWIVRGGYFDRPRHEEAASLPAAATNNLLVTRRALDALAPCFDPRFGLSGGSDHLFTRRAVAAGFEIRWSEGAVVHEPVEPDRANRRWLLRRSFRFGTTTVRCDVELAGARRRAVRVQRGKQHAGLAARAAGRGTLALGRGRRAAAFAELRDVARGVGGVWAAVGGRFEEYRRR
jgi:succinoglycan biosynthesis protein ExoM